MLPPDAGRGGAGGVLALEVTRFSSKLYLVWLREEQLVGTIG